MPLRIVTVFSDFATHFYDKTQRVFMKAAPTIPTSHLQSFPRASLRSLGSFLWLLLGFGLSMCNTCPTETIESHKVLRNDSPYAMQLAFSNDRDTVIYTLQPGDSIYRSGVCYVGQSAECWFEDDWLNEYQTLDVYFSSALRLQYSRGGCPYDYPSPLMRNPIGFPGDDTYNLPDLCGYSRNAYDQRPWYFVYSFTEMDYENATPIE